MIKFGVCCHPDDAQSVIQAGFDYVELGLSYIAQLSDEEFTRVKHKLTGINTYAANSMLPGTLRLTGENYDLKAARKYMHKAFERAHELGIKIVVFGSAGARNVPEGFSHERAYVQIEEFLAAASEIAAGFDITITIEPLRSGESNIINYVSQAAAIAKKLALSNIFALGDFYHMAEMSEPMDNIVSAGDLLLHCHIAQPGARDWPDENSIPIFVGFFSALRKINYSGGVSVEGNCKDFSGQLKPCLAAIKTALQRAYE